MSRSAARAAALLVTLLGLGSSAPSAAEARAQAGTDGRLLALLPTALSVPSPPPRVHVLQRVALPAASASGVTVVPFSAEPLRGLVFRLRVVLPQGGTISARVHALEDAEARDVGAEPRRLDGPAPGAATEPFLGASWGPGQTVVLQRFDHLPRGKAHGLVAITGAYLEGWLEADEAELPDPRAAEGPSLGPLVRRTANWTPTGLSWRSGLVARPGGRYVFERPIPEHAVLLVGLGHEIGSARAPGRFRVLQDGKVLLDQQVPPDDHWRDVELPLQASTRPSRLTLETESIPGPAGQTGQLRGIWAAPRIHVASGAPNLLIVSIDALRADHTGLGGYARDTTPNLDRLASQGVRFDRATSQAPRTWESVTALFTGRYPAVTHVRNRGQELGPQFAFLPDLLARAGYDTYAGSDLANFPPETLTGFDDAEVLPRDKGTTLPQLRRLVPRFQQGGAFAWFHLEHAHYPLSPSEPLRYDPGYAGRFARAFTLQDHNSFATGASVTEAEQRHLIALYDASVRDADAELLGLLRTLADGDVLDNTVVVVTADHGEQLGDHGIALEHLAPYERTLHVPLVMVWSGHLPAGMRVGERVQLVDVLPTLASLLHLEVPADLDGRDLGPAFAGQPLPERPAFSESLARVFTIYEGDLHLLSNPDQQILGVRTGAHLMIRPRELYDVARDPDELHDLAASDPRTADRLEAALRQMQARWSGGGASSAGLGQAAVEALRQAGYLQEVPGAVGSGPHEGPDAH